MHKRLQKICNSLDLPTPVLSGSGSKGISQPYVRRAPLVHWKDLSTILTAVTRRTHVFPTQRRIEVGCAWASVKRNIH